MSDFAILRIEKIKSRRGLRAAEEHNDAGERLRGANLERDWRRRLNEAGVGKPRKDAVLAIELVLSASPQWFERGDADEWRRRSIAWIDEKFGAENVVGLWRHDHEDTPHIHAIAAPLVHKERRDTGRAYVALDSRTVLGGPAGMRALQSSYARALEGLGIARGNPSPRKNEPTRAHRARLDEATRKAEEAAGIARRRAAAAHEVLHVARALPVAFDHGLAVVDDDGRIAATPSMTDENRKWFDGLLCNAGPDARRLADWIAGFYRRQTSDRRERVRAAGRSRDRGLER